MMLSLEDAAKLAGVCVSTFRKHILPNVTTKKIGRRTVVLRASLEEWLGDPKVGSSARSASTGTCDSPTKAKGSLSPREKEILAELRKERLSFTRQQSAAVQRLMGDPQLYGPPGTSWP